MTAVVEASEPQAKEPLIIMLMVLVLLVLTVVVQFILLFKFAKYFGLDSAELSTF